MHQRVDGSHHALRPRLVDAENFLLHLVEQFFHVPFVIVDSPNDTAARLNHLAQQIFFENFVEVVGQVRRAGNGVLQLRQVGNAADLFEQLPVFQMLLHRDEINRQARIEHRGQRLVNRLMSQVVERLLAIIF